MENITALFSEIYLPKKALVVYQSELHNEQVYVEAYDINRQGKPVNAHPLSVAETIQLAETLQSGTELRTSYLKSKGLLPDKVLHIDTALNGHALWHTPEQEVDLLFVNSLNIPSGRAFVPPLLWNANKAGLALYALKSQRKPNLKTPLFRAPFFNLHNDHRVCMGTVDINMENTACLEDFMAQWEHYYWNSYFSHMIAGISPLKGNIIQLWQKQVNNREKFPLDVLLPVNKTVKDLIA
jgi:PRTRC genetic system protein B